VSQARVVQREMFKRGDRVFKEGDKGEKAYLIEKGKIAIVKQSPQGPIVVASIGDKAIFGEMALIDGSSRMATAVAAEDTICIILNARTLADKLRALPQKLRFAFENMVEYVRKTLPFDSRQKAGATAETAQDARIRLILPTPLDLSTMKWEDPFMKALFEMICEYTRRRLPPNAPATPPVVPKPPEDPLTY